MQRELSFLFHSSDPRADISDAGQVVLALQWEHETSGLEKQEGDAFQSLIKMTEGDEIYQGDIGLREHMIYHLLSLYSVYSGYKNTFSGFYFHKTYPETHLAGQVLSMTI